MSFHLDYCISYKIIINRLDFLPVDFFHTYIICQKIDIYFYTPPPIIWSFSFNTITI